MTIVRRFALGLVRQQGQGERQDAPQTAGWSPSFCYKSCRSKSVNLDSVPWAHWK